MLRLTALILALVPAVAWGFSEEVHVSITTEALASLNFESSSFEDVVAGNLVVDKGEFWDPEAHFDSESFAAGSKRLKAKLDAALDALYRCNGAKAREEIGRAFHSVQDFFSHTNWVENHAADEPIDLLELKNPDKDVVCDPQTHKGPLTSGYYFDDREHPRRPTPAPANKCLHDDLNKDSAYRPMHAQARAQALQESKALVERVERAVALQYAPLGPQEAPLRLRLLKGDPSARKTCKRKPTLPNN